MNSGTCNIKINDNANSLSAYHEGTGSCKGFGFMVKEGDVENLGSSNIEVNCSDKLIVDVEGSGKVYNKGAPVLDVKIKGSGGVVNAN